MFKNNFKIAIRNLLRKKIFTLINVLGLAVGIASCLLLLLFIQNEFSYDKKFSNHDRIYRMVLERMYPNHSTFYAIIPQSYEEVAKRDLPEIEESTQAFGFQNFSLSYKDEKDEVTQFDEDFVLLVDSSFLTVFSFDLVKGNRDRALTQANEMVVTEDFAKRYFGDEEPIGKVIAGGQQEFKVVGVCKDVPENSHFNFSTMVSASTFPFTAGENFTGFSAYTYFRLRPGADPAVLEEKFSKLVDTYAAAQIERDLGKSWEDYKKEGNGYRYFLQPLTSIHLDPTNLEVQMKPGGNINTVYIMIAVALLILVIACINFMNLSTARSAERAKEVGLRKVMGSFRQQLVSQFLTESFVVTVISVIFALLFVALALPFFNNLVGKSLALSFDMISVLGLAGFTIIVGVFAGIYPAFILSSFNPVVVMKGKFSGNQKGKWIRNGLVIFQF
ncbi:MAG: ABC transporter permease, partial [Cyclobacteriaceae bacterium]|nr:ABC transporter permease [Cyclobacteriaceae bacterium]